MRGRSAVAPAALRDTASRPVRGAPRPGSADNTRGVAPRRSRRCTAAAGDRRAAHRRRRPCGPVASAAATRVPRAKGAAGREPARRAASSSSFSFSLSRRSRCRSASERRRSSRSRSISRRCSSMICWGSRGGRRVVALRHAPVMPDSRASVPGKCGSALTDPFDKYEPRGPRFRPRRRIAHRRVVLKRVPPDAGEALHQAKAGRRTLEVALG